jgi:hypothetical protein
MTNLHLFRTRLRPLALVVGTSWAFTSTGCYSWRAAPGGTSVAAQRAVDLRLKLKDGRRAELYNARVIGDSLVGTAWDERLETGVRASVALAQVLTVEARQYSPGKTTAAVAALAITGLVVYHAIKGDLFPNMTGFGPMSAR